jgi:N-acyl-D-aspartate/D-glutamate deacylase
MLEQKDIKWNNLYKVIRMCPEAQDLILNQYLQLALEKHTHLAEAYPEILNHAATISKHA